MKSFGWLFITVLFLWIFHAAPLNAQVLNGDSRFPQLCEIRWEMDATEIHEVCRNQWQLMGNTDSTVAYKASFFGVTTRIRFHLERKERKPSVIEVGFEQPTKAIRDTLVNHFTRTTGRAPLINTKEKSAIIFTVKAEFASWRMGKDLVSVISMMRGDAILGLNLLIKPANAEAR